MDSTRAAQEQLADHGESSACMQDMMYVQRAHRVRQRSLCEAQVERWGRIDSVASEEEEEVRRSVKNRYACIRSGRV
jgi:hypothetical protein